MVWVCALHMSKHQAIKVKSLTLPHEDKMFSMDVFSLPELHKCIRRAFQLAFSSDHMSFVDPKMMEMTPEGTGKME